MKQLESFGIPMNDLLKAYFNKEKNLSSFYSIQPDLEGLKHAAENRLDVDRAVLVDVLDQQASSSPYATDTTRNSIASLKNPETYTVCTGHQLCIMGGPLFFFYKICSTIALSRMLNQAGVQTVPVFWMASEDHDYEEVRSIYVNEVLISLSSNLGGAVGRIELSEIDDFHGKLASVFSNDDRYSSTLKELRKIFTKEKTLGQAIRDLVYWVFGETELVVIDADHPDLKRLFAEDIRREIQTGFAGKAVKEATTQLEALGYREQAHARDINLFYMTEGYRERIVSSTNGWGTADAKFSWSENEIDELIQNHPERFSPNVIMRPLYQEHILPNIAYIGGPGETSYWLQLGGVFKEAGVPMPAVLLRDSFMISEASVDRKLEALELTYGSLREGKDELFKQVLRSAGTHEYIVLDTQTSIELLMNGMLDQLADFDPTMAESGRAERTRIMNRLEVLRKKVLRADKKQNSIVSDRLDAIFQWFFPDNTPQERYVNWLHFTPDPSEFVALIDLCDPLERRVKVVIQ